MNCSLWSCADKLYLVVIHKLGQHLDTLSCPNEGHVWPALFDEAKDLFREKISHLRNIF